MGARSGIAKAIENAQGNHKFIWSEKKASRAGVELQKTLVLAAFCKAYVL